MERETVVKPAERAAPQKKESPARLAAPPAAHPLLKLQSVVGNQAVQALVQTKLRVGAPDDPFEREADAIAQQTQTGASAPMAFRKPTGSDAIPEAPPQVEATLNASGSPLPLSARREMEGRFGRDFSQVQVHTDAQAARSAEAIHAEAYTSGSHIAFGAGRFAPETVEGKRLLAHELTHIVQQEAQPAPIVQRNVVPPPPVENRKLIDAALKSKDVGDVKKIKDFGAATEAEKIALIDILLDQTWVGPRDEYALEAIWKSFGADLVRVASKPENFKRWKDCMDRGAELDDLPQIEEIKKRFARDVKELAQHFLFVNREHIQSEMERLGLTHEGQKPTEEQANAMKDLQEAAKIVRRAQEAQRKLLDIQVGYDSNLNPGDTRVKSGYDGQGTGSPIKEGYFNPDRKPQYPPRGDENPPLADWEKVKEKHDLAGAVINGLVNRNPALYALVQQDNGTFTAGNAVATLANGAPEQARTAVRGGFVTVLANIEKTVPKIDDDSLDYRDLKPIHDQLFNGAASTSGTKWNEALNKWAAEDILSDHEAKEFWITLGLGTLAAAAFVVAEIATLGSATFFIAAGAGLLLSGIAAGRSWAHYMQLAEAARTNVKPELAIVSEGQASAALTEAVINTIFFFVDAFGPISRGLRGAAGVAEKAALGARRLATAEQELADLAARETAQKKAAAEIAEAATESEGKAGATTAEATLKRASLLQRMGQRIGQLLEEFAQTLKGWGSKVFQKFGFKGYEVVYEGEYIALYGIRSRILLARFRRTSLEKWIIEDTEDLSKLRHSRASQLGKARSAASQGDDALATLLRQNAVELSEEIGEEAAQAVIRSRFSSAALVFRGKGSGTLDLIFKLGDGTFIVVEAKGGAGKIGSRQVSASVRAEQGTKTYLRDILSNMGATQGGTNLPSEVLNALNGGKLRYFLTETPVPQGTAPLETFLREFL